MKFSKTKLLAAALLLAAGTQQAYAQTAPPVAKGDAPSSNKAGDTISNTASVKFTVDGVEQTAPSVSDPAVFTVDRLVNVTVTAEGSTDVNAGATAKALAFTVTNNTNDDMQFLLDSENVATGGNDKFDALLTGSPGVKYYVDVNEDGVFNATEDGPEITVLPSMSPNDVLRVFVVADMPNPAGTVEDPSLANGDQAHVRLKATATLDGSTPAVATTASDDPGQIDTVFGDLAGDFTGDDARDGSHSDENYYVVATAEITVTKRSGVIWDPVNGYADATQDDGTTLNTHVPKAIPGATMVYCIAVHNGSDSVNATSVTVSDQVPEKTTYKDGTIRVVAGEVTNCDYTALTQGDAMTDADDTETLTDNPAGTKGKKVVAGSDVTITTVTDLAAEATTTTIFQVTID